MEARPMLGWIFLVTCCGSAVVPALGGMPLLFPSVDEVDSLVYDEATATLLPVQASFPFFLCSTASDTFSGQTTSDTCDGKVVFTQKRDFSLTLLYLSDDGILQPVPNQEITIDEGVELQVSPFGHFGLISDDGILPVVRTPTSEFRVGRKLLQDVVSTTDSDANTGDSLEAVEDAIPRFEDGQPEEAEAQLGEDSAEPVAQKGQIFRTSTRLIDVDTEEAQVLLSSGVGFIVDGSDNVVMDISKFNISAALEDPTRVHQGLTFVVEIKLAGLSENKVHTLRVSAGGSEREVKIFRDTSSPVARINTPKKKTRVKERAQSTEIKFEIIFSEGVFPVPRSNKLECNSLQEAFGDLLGFEGLSKSETVLQLLNISTLTFHGTISDDLAEIANVECGNMIGNLLNFDAKKLYSLGGNVLSSSADYKLPQLGLKLGDFTDNLDQRPELLKIIVRVKINPRQRDSFLNVKIGSGSIMDFAAITNNEDFERDLNLTAHLEVEFDGKVLAPELIDKGKSIGTAATTVTATTVALSVTTTVAVSVAASVSASVGGTVGGSVVGSAAVAGGASAAAGGAGAGGSLIGAVQLLNVGQTINLLGQLNVRYMPENFHAFTNQLSWTMFDVKAPWSEADSEDYSEESQAHRRLQGYSDNAEKVVFSSDSKSPRDLVKRVFFWIGFVLAVLLVLHASILGVLVLRRIRIPSSLRFPRIELLFTYWAIPAIAKASAELLKSDTGDKILGALLIAVFPFAFTMWHVYMLIKYFFIQTHIPKAVLVYEGMENKKPATVTENGLAASLVDLENSGESSQTTRTDQENLKGTTCGCWRSCWGIFESIMERLVYTPLLGAPYHKGKWIAPKGPSSMFSVRYGPMFEKYRFQPKAIRGATFVYNRENGKMDRGIVSTAPKVSKGWEHSAVGYAIQISGRTIEMMKLVFMGLFIGAEDDPQSTYQALVLLVLTLAYVIVLRVFRPPLKRWDLGVTILGEIANILSYIVFITISNLEGSHTARSMKIAGIILLATQGASFAVNFVDNFFEVWEVGQIGMTSAVLSMKEVAKTCTKSDRGLPRMRAVVTKAHLQNPRYLERKYFHIWVFKTLGKRIHTLSALKRKAPLEERMFGLGGAVGRK